MKQWHYALNGQQQGPVTAEEIRQLQASGVINGFSLVWCAELTEWTPLGSVSTELLPAALPGSPLDLYQPQPEVAHPFVFQGKAGEFFRIWIVNVVLTVLTLGIYAAWAKVRTRRYFYGNTLLDGKPFDFTGNPIAILKGNLIFGGLFVLYTVMLQLYVKVGIGILLLILAIMPWMIQKALKFRAQNTVHRNVRFNFRGSLSEAYGVFLGLIFLIPFTLGFILPYMQFRQMKYFLGNLGWGSTQAQMNGKAGFYYVTFFKYIGMIIAIVVVAGVVMGGTLATKMMGAKNAEKSAQVEQTQDTSSSSNPLQTKMEQEVRGEIEKQIQANPNLSEQEKEQMRAGAAAGAKMAADMVYMIVPLYLLMFVAVIYYQVRIGNYSINTTQWGQLGRIESTVRVRDLLWLYVTNGLAVLCSFGLLIPWVKIRMARYRLSRTTLIASGSLDAVAQSLSGNESAIGDAGADIFDFEIGF